MENGFGHSIIQVDNEPAIIQLAEQHVSLVYHIDIPQLTHIKDKVQWNVSIRHFVQVRSIKFDLVD
eukprot:5575079-Amphidinium_carterae.1